MTLLRVLIVGGYGTFGGRLARLLAPDARLELLIAGRSVAAAEKFRAVLAPGAVTRAVTFDRAGDVLSQLTQLAPDVVVDASGPFQAYGAEPYRLVKACIACRIDYLDLADGSDFVDGVAGFDQAAREAGIFVISGASSFPALTAAVVRRLAQGIDTLQAVHAGIAPSPYAGVGLNVIRAITSYGGKPIRRLQDGKLARSYPLIDSLRYTIAPPGEVPLHDTRFTLVDVPELREIPRLWPSLQTVWVGAGPVPPILHRMLSLLAWLVRLHLLPSLLFLSPLFHRVTNRLRWGEHRGGMFVAVSGQASGQTVRRSWHLLAEGDDGPMIPAMTAAALIRRAVEGQVPASGARSAATALELDDYDFFFAARQIVTGLRDDDEPGGSLYRRLLRTAWERLPPALQQMHDTPLPHRARGEASVERGQGMLANLIAGMFGFPKANPAIPVEVTFEAAGDGQRWRRNFGGSRFVSRQRLGRGRSRGLLLESFGPITVALAVPVHDGKLRLIVRRWSLFGIPMPRFLAPSGEGVESAPDGRFQFDVEIKAPLIGRLVRYRGWLVPVQEA